jgi:hypothetical protein
VVMSNGSERTRESWVGGLAGLRAEVARLTAERDALQARLDSMTAEWEYGLLSPDAREAHLVSANREHIERQQRRGHPSIRVVKRTAAGPWVEVKGEGGQ